MKNSHLQATLRPGDELLVEGNTRISGAIKYLTQSTWSHAALYVGMNFSASAPEDHCLVDADTVNGVRSTGLDRFINLHTRICRPIGLSHQECSVVAQAAIDKIGCQYDLRNVFDLARYLFPTPPVPTRFRRQSKFNGHWLNINQGSLKNWHSLCFGILDWSIS